MSRPLAGCRRVTLVFAALILFAAPSGAQHKARDRTVGACTRKDEFSKWQAKLDPRIQELVRAPEARKAKLGVAIARKYGRGQRIENLIRYRHPDLKHVFLPLLEAKHWPIRARALYGLKMVADESVIPAVVKRLEDRDPRVREMAANCLCHIGREPIEALDAARATEEDPFTRSSIEAAAQVLAKGKKPYRAWTEKRVGPDEAPRVEWAWTVKGRRSFNVYDARTLDCPEAKSLDWPISWYHGSLFCSVPRRSFGGKSGHAGEDMAWFREGASVYATGDGLVRMIQGAGGNWGFLVLIEHRLPDGDYVCSVHGHLGWDILVKEGQVVKKRQKIGTVGLSCSVENGGYGAHLHFGLADGPFRKPRGIYRDGSALNFDYKGKRVKAPVIGFAYLPDKPDKNKFPGLGLKVKVPDGTVLTVAVGNVPMAHQVGWITGYAKRCRGWFDPYEFIKSKQGD